MFELFKHPKIQRYWPYFCIALLFFPITLIFGRAVYAPSDDMYIFLVYVRNFLDGNGLTYNGTVVEGFTSVFWVGLLTLFGYLKIISLPMLAEGLSALSGLFALFTTYKLARSMGIRTEWLALLPSGLLVLTGDFAFYSVVGLEEVLFTALIALVLAQFYSRPTDDLLKSKSFPLLLATMILTRPEGALIAGLIYLVLLRRENLGHVIRNGLTLVLYLAPVILIKRYYYGYWLPNTWYVKGGAGLANLEHGIVYFLFNIERYLVVLSVIVALIVFALLSKRTIDWKSLLPLGLILVTWLVYIIIQGGDNMVGGRFLLPILPILYCLVVKLSSDIQLRSSYITLSALVLGLSLFYGYVANPGLQRQAQSWRDAFEVRKSAGQYLHEYYPADTVVALNQAGIIPYYSQLQTVDMLGLNDVYIAHQGQRDFSLWYAHQAGDGAYVLSRNPDIIIFSGLGLSAQPGDFISDREIWMSEHFKNNYELLEWPEIGFVYVRNGDQ